MLNGNLSYRYYLFSLSNLISAFGGGLILGKGIGVINVPYLKGGSVLAFFIGTVLGLVFLQLIPGKFSKSLTKSFSICCALTSLILFFIYQNYAYQSQIDGNVALLFFVLLCIRFSFWFYSRVVRASSASGYQQSIAWVEMGYYLGMVLGLMIWKLLGINIALGAALIVDASSQFISAILDFKGSYMEVAGAQEIKSDIQSNLELQLLPYNSWWCWKLGFAVVFMTLGIQVVIFNLSHYVTEAFGSHIIAIFYSGVAIAAFYCNKYKFYVFWENNTRIAFFSAKNTTINLGMPFLVILSFLSVVFVIYEVGQNITTTSSFSSLLVYAFVFVAAFIYEVISLALLDRLGYEEKRMGRSGMVMRTYGLMGLGAAICLWLLSFIDDLFTSSIVTVGLCLFFATFIIMKREPIPHNIALFEE